MSINTNRNTDICSDCATEDTEENETTSLLANVSIKNSTVLSFTVKKQRFILNMWTLAA